VILDLHLGGPDAAGHDRKDDDDADAADVVVDDDGCDRSCEAFLLGNLGREGWLG
jgi:hypothetical protein